MKILHTTPSQDGFYMPAEFAPQDGVFMIWPERPDNWRDGAKPAQAALRSKQKAFFAPTACWMMQAIDGVT